MGMTDISLREAPLELTNKPRESSSERDMDRLKLLWARRSSVFAVGQVATYAMGAADILAARRGAGQSALIGRFRLCPRG